MIEYYKKNQTDPVENGIYIVKSGSWIRANDLDTDLTFSFGIFTFIEKSIINLVVFGY